MKFKEYPRSLWTACHLRRLPLSRLGKGANTEDINVVVSLTSIPSRLHCLPLVIRSLLAQTLIPQKVILWLHHDLQARLPTALKQLLGQGLEVHYCDETSAHRKLVKTLELLPDSTIVTCDDDVMYPPDWLKRLWQEHLKNPQDILAHECRRICYDSSGTLLPYQQWPSEEPGASHEDTLAIGYGGVLYPPNSLPKETLNRALYAELAPRADDLWYKAMSLRHGTAVRRSAQARPKPIPIAFSQRIALKKDNVREDMNRTQWQRLSEHFHISPFRNKL